MRTKQDGFTLIEVMVSMLILAIGLLGTAAMMATSIKSSQASFQRSVAVVQANDLVERLWAAACQLDNSNHVNTIKTVWQDQHKSGPLAGWSGTLTDNTSLPYLYEYEIQIEWSNERLESADPSEYAFKYTVIIPELTGCP